MINKFIKNRKGVSLIELVVAISILSIISAPFIASIVTSQNNNIFAKNKLDIANNIQSIVEEIKIQESFIIEEYNYFKDRPGAYKDYVTYSDENFIYKYRIEKVSEGLLSDRSQGNEKVYSSFTEIDGDSYFAIDYDVEFVIQDGNLIFSDVEYSLEDSYEIIISGSSENYNYNFEKNSVQVDTRNFNNTVSSINIGIIYKDTEDGVFDLDVNIFAQVDKDVKFYVVGDCESRLNLNNSGSNMFYVQKNLIESPVLEYTNDLYKIDIIVLEDGIDIERMVSYVKL